MAVRDRRLAELISRPDEEIPRQGAETPLATAASVRSTIGLLILFAALATLHTWPMATDPAHLTRLDNDDTAFNTWVIAWVQHQLTHEPLALFEAPIFYPARHALAFSEHMLTQSIIGLPLYLANWSPVLIYNVLVWLGYCLSGFAMAVVMRAWTGSVFAGVVAGCLFAFNAHLLTRYAHLQALHLQFFPVVLYAFDRVLQAARVRYVVLLVGMFVVQSLCSNYTMVMMAAALVAAFAVRLPELWGRPRVWVHLAVAGVAASTLLAPFLFPYYVVREEQGLSRTIEDIRLYSATWRDYLATAGRLHYDTWSAGFLTGRTALFPGIAASGLAIYAVANRSVRRSGRARMAIAFGLVGLALSFGAALPGYGWLQEHIPLLQGIRAAARWGLLLLIAIAILAGFAAAELERRWRTRRWWPAIAAALVLVITLEAARAPLVMQRFDGIPDVHSRLAPLDIHAMVVFPLYGGSQFNLNAQYLLHQTRHWKPMLNAYSSFAPPIFYELADRLQTFPDDAALQLLRTNGFSHVLLHRAPLERDYGRASVDGLRTHPALELIFDADGVMLFRVR